MEKPAAGAAARTGGARLRQAGALRMDNNVPGFHDQRTSWRSGDNQPWTLNGSAARVNGAPKASGWRQGDISGFSLTGDHRQGPPLPEHAREGGVARRANAEILPYNDGSQLQAQTLLDEQKSREKQMKDEITLGGGAGVQVTSVPRGYAQARYDQLRTGSDQKGYWREELWDKRPFAIDGSERDRSPMPGQPGGRPTGRHRSDITADGTLTAKQMVEDAAARSEQYHLYEPRSEWRLGDDQPYRVDFSPVRRHEKLLSSHQAEWRAGDPYPLRLNDDQASDQQRDLERREAIAVGTDGSGDENYARRHTDVAFHMRPAILDARRIAASGYGDEITPQTSLNHLLNGAAMRYGPRADAGPDFDQNAGLSWAEMGRRGMLKHSASDQVLMPARRRHGAYLS